jgi:hypothetical protein
MAIRTHVQQLLCLFGSLVFVVSITIVSFPAIIQATSIRGHGVCEVIDDVLYGVLLFVSGQRTGVTIHWTD